MRVDSNARAYRLIIQLTTIQYYEVIVEISLSSTYKILEWRSLTNLDNISPTPFEKYFPAEPDQDLSVVLSQSNIGTYIKIKKIISSERKPSPDGIYYRLFVEADDS